MKTRYKRNLYALSEDEQKKLSEKRVCIVGCGGLGGYLLEYLLRIGIGHITVIDGDCFEESNLNPGSAASDRRENGQNVAILHRILWFAVETIDEEDGNLLFRYLKFLQNIRSTAVFVSFEKEDFTSSFPKGCKQSDFDHFPTHSSRPSFFRVSSVGNASTHPLAS